MLRRALVNCVQGIGEAAARMTEAGRARAPDLPWGQIVATRNILVHAHFRVDLNILWDVIGRDLPPLITSVERALAGVATRREARCRCAVTAVQGRMARVIHARAPGLTP
jgi:uncharacterized protein with HEPN domain